ncbi:hypothetical protein CHU32_27570 [Superficieibacter electus]|uniref:DUF4303 domain-containing protein n=1 Tax=Superficieibacter electus TaxID=2022662 RepID=A0A2P5GGR7_9ENTR|nr:DUF4303 domain-containing protein [Superficieibacter electus]POP40410.1 hypothetical protein CHU33_27480 [Superficieibacter electus]POP40869.1 hypothetical protein CHU32_27570 [Superficieibacter electus]
MSFVSEEELLIEVEKAANIAFCELLKNEEHFYYCSLITTGEALSPSIAAWSHEALVRYLIENNYNEGDAKFIRWSYAESPYFNFGIDYFEHVNRLFSLRPKMDYKVSKSDWDVEFNIRLKIMETAMKHLDEEGVFGAGDSRNNIIINVEVMPPDYRNTLRAMRLNPPEALSQWLVEAAEPIP